MNWIIYIGYLAGTLTTFAQLPQIFKSLKTKKTTDISLFMYITLVIGVILWLLYGILINDFPLILANLITLIIVTIILILKVRYG